MFSLISKWISINGCSEKLSAKHLVHQQRNQNTSIVLHLRNSLVVSLIALVTRNYCY